MSAYEETPRTPGATSGGEDVKERATEAAAEVNAGAKHVAGVTGEEARSVARDAKSAARGFISETRTQLSDQASSQQRRAAGALRSTSDELQGMASGSSSGSGPAASAARALGEQTSKIADWLEQREPADLVYEVRSFARRHTGAFVAIATGVGLLAGRLTRALVQDARDDSDSDGGTYGGQSPALVGGTTGYADGTPGYATGTTGYAAGAGAGTIGGGQGAGDTPIGDALASEPLPGDPLSPGVETTTSGTQGLTSPDDPARDEWSPSGEGRL